MVQVAVKNRDNYFLFHCNGIEIIGGQPCFEFEKNVRVDFDFWDGWLGLSIEFSAVPDYYVCNDSISESEFVRLFNEQLQSEIEAKHEPESVNHPNHYGGENNPLEVINIIEHYDLGFHLGNVVKYVLRAGKKGNRKEDLKKALWYLEREIKKGGENG